MATRLKTVEYWFPFYSSTIPDNTDTALTGTTIYIPESSPSFKSCTVDLLYHVLDVTMGHINRQQVSFRLGAASYTVWNNTVSAQVPQGGENMTVSIAVDVTSHFTANWSGSSMTADLSLLVDSASTAPLGTNNVSARVTITYEYDDTSATHVKTVWIPLDAPTGELPASKPGSPTDTIPQLTGSGSPYLPENSPTIRQLTIVVQGLSGSNLTTDKTFSMEVGTLGAATSGLYEHGSTVDMFFRFHAQPSFTTTASQSWYLWNSVAGAGHCQAWMVVTYEFTVSGTTTLLNSVLVPMEMSGPAGGTTSSDYQRGIADLWIEEPATITTQRLAAMMFWSASALVSGINMRLGTGSFVAYTDDFQVYSGGPCAMIRNDGAYTLARGRNEFSVDAYRTDTTDLMWGICGFVMVNYHSGVPTAGPGAANHTVMWTIHTHQTTALTGVHVVPAVAPAIPETSYFLSAVGILVQWLHASGSAVSRFVADIERLSAEGGVRWELIYSEPMDGDPETGVQWQTGRARHLFKRWPGDPDADRMDIETARRWRLLTYTFSHLWGQLMLTYHTQSWSVAGTVSGYADADGAGLTVEVFRNLDKAKVAEVTTTTGGAYSATVYDNSGTYFATCREDATHVGRSDDVTPS